MLFPEEDVPLLKKWIVKRLENTSDADADVLADYVLALLRHDGDAQAVRSLCEAEIPDFLKEDSAVFVRDVFDAINWKLYLPGAAPPRGMGVTGFPPPTGPAAPYGILGQRGPSPMGLEAQNGNANLHRKRSWNHRGEMDTGTNGNGWVDGRAGQHHGGDVNGRAYKQPRRGGPGMGRGDYGNNYGRGGFQGQPPHPSSHPGNDPPPQAFPNVPGLPSPPPGIPPFDPNNPMGAILAMQALGFPVPGLPQFPPAGDAEAQPRKQRCRDYDLKGFCGRGNRCPFEHGQDSIYVPPGPQAAGDEYDPSNSTLMAGLESGNGHNNGKFIFNNTQGNDRGRGRGRIRGDRGGQHNAARRGNRAEFSSDRPNYDKSKTIIVVENIPEQKFSEDEVRAFFSEFGNILEVSMRPYKRLAIVKFDIWDAAKAAYSSPKVIFDNRFVKVYWFTDQASLPQPPAVGTANEAGKTGVANSTVAPLGATSEPQIDVEEFARKQQEVQKAHDEKLKKMAEMEVARKELERRQEALLKSQAEEKRKLMERIAAKGGTTGSITTSTPNTTILAPTEEKPTSQTEALKKQLAALEAEAQSLGIDTSLTDESSSWSHAPRGRGRGGYIGRGAYVYAPRGYRGWRGGRGGVAFGGGAAATGAYKLDNRTKRVAVSGVDFTVPEMDEALREYLLGIGDFTTLERSSDRTTITFKDRFTAEKFMYGTSEIPSVGKVELAWIQTPLPQVNAAVKTELKKTNGEDEGDAMTGVMDEVFGVKQERHEKHEQHEQHQQEHIDYDVADDDGWGPE